MAEQVASAAASPGVATAPKDKGSTTMLYSSAATSSLAAATSAKEAAKALLAKETNSDRLMEVEDVRTLVRVNILILGRLPYPPSGARAAAAFAVCRRGALRLMPASFNQGGGGGF